MIRRIFQVEITPIEGSEDVCQVQIRNPRTGEVMVTFDRESTSEWTEGMG
jgi:hypothetical protein